MFFMVFSVSNTHYLASICHASVKALASTGEFRVGLNLVSLTKLGLVLIYYMRMSPQGVPWLARMLWRPAISCFGIGPEMLGPADVDDTDC